ncbi:MAG: T9SS type A sorting domain-containing protein [Bacteroidia bacterium]
MKNKAKFKLKAVVYCFFTLFSVLSSKGVFGQASILNYAFTTNNNGSLALDANSNAVDMTTGTTELVAPFVNAGSSQIETLPFQFYFMGNRFNQFSVNSYGVIQLGNASIASNTFFGSTSNLIAPFSPSSATGNAASIGTSTTGKIHYKVVGTFPNRCLVIEFLNMRVSQSSSTTSASNLCTYQARLYEGNGMIEFMYGNMFVDNLTNLGTFITGIASSTSVFQSVNINTHTASVNPPSIAGVSYGFTSTGNITSLHSTSNPNRRFYRFTPSAPATPTSLSFTNVTGDGMIVNWVDNAINETGYDVYVSNNGGIDYYYLTSTVANVSVYTATNLQAGTTYHWAIIPRKEGYGTALIGSQATTGASTITATTLGGNWSSPSTWVGGVVPGVNNNVVIPNNSTVTIDATNLYCRNLTVGGGTSGTLQYSDAVQGSLFIVGDLVVNSGANFTAGTGTLTNHILVIGGLFTNQITSGNLTVNGNFDMNTSAAVATTFAGILDATISGSGTIDFFSITVNKGISSNHYLFNPTLTCNSVITIANATGSVTRLTLTSGTFRLNSASTLNVYGGSQTICSSGARLWINNAGATIRQNGAGTTSNAGSPTISGELRIDNGTFEYGSGNNTMTIASTGTLRMSNGTLNMFGAISFTSNANCQFLFSGGTINVNGNLPTANQISTGTALFTINTFTTVIWTGGTINIINPHSAAGGTAWNAVSGGNKVVSGGTLNIGDGVSTVSGGTFGTTVGFGLTSTMPLWIVNINNLANTVNTRQARLTGAFNVKNNFTVSANGVLAMGQSGGNQTLQIGGNATIAGNINGHEIGSSFVNGTIYFNGNTAQSLTISGSITNLQGLQLRNPAGLTLNNNLTVSRVTLETGVLNNSGATLTIGRATAGDVPTITIGSGSNLLPPGSFSTTPTFNITAGNYKYIYNQTNGSLSQGLYNEVPTGSSISVRQFTINNTNGITLTKSIIADTTQMTAGNIILGANDYQIGTSATTTGSFTYTSATAGFFVTSGTGRLIRWMGTSGLPTTNTVGGLGHFPLGSGVYNRNVFIWFSSATAFTAGGTIAMRHVEATGSTSITSYTDGTLTGVDKRSNSYWEITTPTAPTMGAFTITIRVQGTNVMSLATSLANVTLSTATGLATGTWVSGPGTVFTDPIAQRSSISSIANLTASPYYMAAPNANYIDDRNTIFSAASGDWSNTATWQGGVVPTSNDNVIIQSGHTINLDNNGSGYNLTVNNGASLNVNANTLTLGPSGGGNILFDHYGTLTVGGGTINVNGNMIINSGSNFYFTSGNINIDGNNGTLGGSVSSSYDLFSIGRAFPTSVTYSSGVISVTGGTLTIVDPPINGSSNYSFAYRTASGFNNNWEGNTFILGGSTGTHKSGHTNGFLVGTYISIGRLQLGNVIVNGGNLNNTTLGGRFVSTPTSSASGFDCMNLTVNANSEIRQPSTAGESINVAGNLINNGLITIQTTSTAEGLRFCMLSGVSEVASIYNQSVSGSGEWRNLMPATPTLSSGGTNYQVGDVLTITNGTYSRPVRYMVTAVVAGTGAISTLAVSDPGAGYTSLPVSPFTVTGGSGTGAAISSLTTTNLQPTASVSSLIINNASSTAGSGVNPINWNINNFWVGNNLTFTAGILNIGSNTITLGTELPVSPFTRTQMGTITQTAGGFQMTTGAVRRVFSGTLPTTQGTNVGLFPIVDSVFSRNVWLWFSSSTAPTTAGIVSVGINRVSGINTISTPFVENAITYNRRTNTTWTISIPNAITWSSTPTISMRLAGANLIAPSTVANLNLINNASGGSAAPGSFSAGTGTTAAPEANRTAIPYASLANTYTLGASTGDLSIQAIADGNWGNPAIWNTGTVPTSTDNVTIPSPFTVTLAGGTPPYACNNLTINSGGTLIANSNTLNIGPTGGGNRLLSVAGKLEINGGTINVNGRVDFVNAATTIFTFTSGNLNIDGNDGTLSGSVASGTVLCNVGASITANAISGTITIVDPPFSGSAAVFSYSINGIWPNVNLVMGDGVSTHPSTAADGFLITTSSARFGNLTINGGSAMCRWATINGTTFLTSNLNVNTASQLRISGTCGVAGNVINNGTLITSGTLSFSLSGAVVTTGGQSATGTGVYRNNIPSATIAAGGSGYTIGDVLTVAGLGGTPMQITVTGTSSGTITSAIVSNIGEVTSISTNPHSVTGGTGTGATFNISGAIPFALFTNLTTVNNTASGVDISAISSIVDPAAAMSTVSGTLSIGATAINVGSNRFVIGFRDNNSSPANFGSGSTSYIPGLGRIITTNSYSRFYNSAGSAPIATAQHIYILGTATDARYAAIYFGATSSIATSGYVSVSHSPSNTLNTPTPFSDCSGLFNINRVTAASWTFETAGGLTLGTNPIDTANIVLYPYGIIRPIIATDIFVTQATSAAPGNCAAGTGTTAQPTAVRTGLNSTQFNSTYRVGAEAANLSLITSIASGDWNDPSIWDASAVPTSSDNVRIALGHTVNLNTNANAISLNVQSGGILNAGANTLNLSTNLIVGGDINASGATFNITGSGAGNGISILNGGILNISAGTVNLGPTGGGNRTLNQAAGGTLTISGGTLNVNGNVLFNGGTFNMSGGEFNVDGNSGASATSVNASTTSIFSIITTLGGTVNGGTITIVDPHFDIGVTSTYAFNSNAATMDWTGNTLNIGDGSSTQSSSKINGFGINMTSNHILGNVNIRGGSTSRRFAAIGSGSSGSLNCNNLNVFSGSELRTFSDDAITTSLNVMGNLTNDGILRISGLLAFRRATSELSVNNQTLSGTGTFASNSARVSTISSGGTGYTVGDILTLVGGVSTTQAQFIVTSASSGVITGLAPWTLGSYTADPIYPASLSGGTGSGATVNITNLISRGSIGHLTFLNGNASGINWNLNNLNVRGTLAFSTTTSVLNIVNLGTNNLYLGDGTDVLGTLNYSAGGFTTTSGKFGRWFSTSSLPTTITSTGQYPFVNSTGALQRHAYIYFSSATALTTGGRIDVNYVDGSGLTTITPFLDGSYSINRISNAVWNYSAGSLPVLDGSASVNVAVRGDGITSIINTLSDIRLTQSAIANGSHIAGSGSVTNPNAIRNYTTLGDIFTNHVFSGNATNFSAITAINTIAAGNWGDPTIWNTSAVPGEFNNVTISHQVFLTGGTPPFKSNQLTINSGGELIVGTGNSLELTSATTINSGGNLYINGGAFTGTTGSVSGGLRIASGTITFAGASATGLTINSGGRYNQWGGTLNVGIGLNNARFNMASGSGDTLTGGTVNINGNLLVTGTFRQTDGLITVDGNSGNAATSVAASDRMVQFNATVTNINCSGGTIRIVDPHHSSIAASSTTKTLVMSMSASTTAFSGTHTFEFGDGASTTPGNSDGFVIETYQSSRVPIQNVIVNAGSVTGRWVSTTNQLSTAYGTHIKGNLTINSGSEFRHTNTSPPEFNIGGNIVNNGTLTISQPFVFGNTSILGTLSAQNVSGTGTFRNAVSGPTGSFNNVTFDNTNGITFANNITIAGSATFTNGNLTIGNTTLTLNGSVVGMSAIRSISSGGSGNITVSGSGTFGTLFFDQTTPGTTNRLNNLVYNRASQTITLGNELQVTGVVTPTAGTLATGGFLTLVSNATGTAKIEQGSGSYLTGNVTVQRYVAATGGNRRWRYLAAPFSAGPTFASSWQQQIHITGSGTGGTACPTLTSHSNGFDASTFNNPSIVTFNESVATSAVNFTDGWQSIPNTNSTNLTAGVGYNVWSRGNRTIGCSLLDGTLPSHSAVTLSATGTVVTGNFSSFGVTFNASNGEGWNLVGNPYPSNINWDNSGWTRTNIDNTYYQFNPISANFASWNGTIGVNGGGPIIPSGMAFLVKANASSPVLAVTEAVKTSTEPGTLLLKRNIDGLVTMSLIDDAGNFDEHKIVIDSKRKDIFESDFDAEKFMNPSLLNLYSWFNYNIRNKTSINLCINGIAPVQPYSDKVVNLGFEVPRSGNYKLNISLENLNQLYEVYLIDNFLNTRKLIFENHVEEFTVSSNPESSGKNRFQIVFENYHGEITSLKTSLNDKLKLHAYPNPNNGVFNISSNKPVQANSLTVEVYNATGVKVLSHQSNMQNTKQALNIPIDLSEHKAGVYLIELTSENGKIGSTKIVKY